MATVQPTKTNKKREHGKVYAHSRHRVAFTVTLDPAVYKVVEKNRGKVPRSVYISDIIAEHFKLEAKS